MKIYFIFIFLILTNDLHSQKDSRGIRNWKADWIVNPDNSIKQNQWSLFKKEFDLAKKVNKNINAYISADSKYWLYVNDQMIVFDGNLKRGPNPKDGYYDVVPLSKHLKTGKNKIEILLWYWGRDGFSYKSSGRSGLIFELEGKNVSLLSSSDWQVANHPAYYTTAKENPNYRLPEFNVAYDARKTDWVWNKAGIIGRPPIAPWNELWKRPIPLWSDSGLKSYESVTTKHTDSSIVVRAKLPKNIYINPYFEIETQSEGFRIDIRTDNYVGGSEPNLRTEYLTKKGKQKFESVGYFNGHEVIYTLPKDVKIKKLMYRETRYNSEYIGQFITDNPRLNTLIEKSKNTLNVNMRDGIQDPDRERAQWWGDVVNIMGMIFYGLDNDGDLSVKKAISNLFEWQKSDGVLFSPIPAGNWDKELPAQMLASIGKFGLWSYLVYTRDTLTIQESYPKMKKYLNIWEVNENGFVKNRQGGWSWYDWGDSIDVELLDQLWYYQAMQAYSKIAEINLDPSEVERANKLIAKMKNNIISNYWQGEYYVSSTYPKGTMDDRANGLAALLDFTDGDKWSKMKNHLYSTRKSGPYMEKYIVEAFFANGDAQMGFDRMMDRYVELIDSPITTLWEGWKVGSGTYGGGTYNHGWSCWPMHTSGRYIAGITPHEYNPDTLIWTPNLSVINKAQYKFDLLDNVIKIDYKRSTKSAVYNLKMDQNKSIKFYLNNSEWKNYSKIKLNGIEINTSNMNPVSKMIQLYVKGKSIKLELVK